MKKGFPILALLIITSGVYAQPVALAPPVAQPPQRAPEAISAPKSNFPAYAEVLEQSRTSGKPFVAFFGVKARVVPGLIVAESRESAKGAILVSWDGYRGEWLPANASDLQIRQAAGLEASRMAIPFDKSRPAPPTADDSPWLSRAESERIKKAWPKKLAFPKNLKFYDLAPRYQSLTTSGNGRNKHNTITPVDDFDGRLVDAHLLVSGGMANIDRSTWHSVKGMDLPDDAKIRVWQEDSEVRAFALVPRFRWKFPQDTVAYDVLFAGDSIFEIRTQTKSGDDWETKVSYKDASIAPNGYHGAGRACASCHNSAGEIVGVPGKIYLRVRWGDDGRFSWRPFDEAGKIDRRWPIEGI